MRATLLTFIAALAMCEGFHVVAARPTALSRARQTTMGPFDFLAFGKAGASHILLSDSGKARYIKSEIEDGRMTFAAAAKQYSTCPSAAKGGDLGVFGRGAMVGPFDSYCFDPETKVGDLEIVRTNFGTHIVKLTKKP